MKELRRDLSNKMLGGVCSGIARYLNDSGKIFKPMAPRQQGPRGPQAYRSR